MGNPGSALWPHFAEQWTHANLWGLTIAGMPLEEYVWSLAFGSTWPLIIAHVLEARVVPANTAIRYEP